MTKKDYELIARVFKSENATAESKAISELAEMLAYELGLENPRFNRSIFLKACGVSN
jgi:hypothetical protein